MAIIALEGMCFFAFHGLYAEEAEKGNHFEVDVWIDTGARPLPRGDTLEGTVDYGRVFVIAAEVMGARANLLETLVARIGERICGEMTGFDKVRVRVSKMHPPVDGECRRSYVEAEFRVSDQGQ